MMELVSITPPLFNLDLIILFKIAIIMLPVFTVFMFSFPTPVLNSGFTNLGQIQQCDSSLSEFHYRADNKEHEYKERIDRKRSILFQMVF